MVTTENQWFVLKQPLRWYCELNHEPYGSNNYYTECSSQLNVLFFSVVLTTVTVVSHLLDSHIIEW